MQPSRAVCCFALLGAAMLVCIGLRSLSHDAVFPEPGVVRLGLHDSAYHARRALWSFANFPSALAFDHYLAYPDGAVVPNPPLFDWWIGGTARLFGSSEQVFLVSAAWSAPILAAVTLLVAFAIGRRLGGNGVGLGAAWLYAVLPMAVLNTGLGNLDHHAAVGALAAAWLLSSVRWGSEAETIGLPAILVRAALMASMLLTWSGSLLYLLLSEGALLVAVGTLSCRSRLLGAQAASALVASVFMAPWLLVLQEVGSPRFSATTLSWLHAAALVGVATLCLARAALERWQASRSWWEATWRTVAVAALLAGVLCLVPGLTDALASGVGFLGKRDMWAASNPEQWPLYSFLGPDRVYPLRSAVARYGGFAPLVPVAFLLPLWAVRGADRRAPAWILALWCAVLGVLAILQVRFGQDFAAPAAVAFALGLEAIGRRLARIAPSRVGFERVAAAACVLLGLLLVAPAAWAHYRKPLPVAVAGLLRLRPAVPAVWLTPRESLLRFTEEIRRVTPETAGYLAPGRPDYAVLCLPTFGHTVVWGARRPTPAGNFGPYLGLGADRLRSVWTFFRTGSEEQALEIARGLGARYVLSAAAERLKPGSIGDRLQRRDGSAGDGHPHLGRFRLVTEGPARGRPLRLQFPSGRPPPDTIPYKLFELVEGAELRVRAPTGSSVVAELELVTPIARRLQFRAEGFSEATGFARLRVPYATRGAGDVPTRADGPYRVLVDGSLMATVDVRSSDVDQAREVLVHARPVELGR